LPWDLYPKFVSKKTGRGLRIHLDSLWAQVHRQQPGREENHHAWAMDSLSSAYVVCDLYLKGQIIKNN
ncbi:MAG TPA: hypothetical protein PKH54_04830, partial [Myxococcota bacterium]|nr:hypothetical protein [Myxococcota bacterium]